MALQLVDKAGGGEVTLVSMAPNNEVSGLRTALAMGAAKAILVSDPALAGSDSLSTAKVLAKAIERAGDVDLVLAATESTDGYTGTTPAQVAELLGWPSLTFAKHVEVGDGKVTIQRQTEAGYDVVEASLPAVVSVTAGVVEPRYPSFKGIMAAKNKPVDEVTAADLGLGADSVGWAGSRQEITKVAPAPAREAGEKIEDDGEAYRARRGVPRGAQGRLTGERSVPLRRSQRPTDIERGVSCMGLAKVWVFAEAEGDKPATSTLELLTKAREVGDTVECVYVGANADALAASLGEHGATKVFAVDPGDALARRRRRRGAAVADRGATRPTSCCSRRPTTAATRSPGCR